MTQNLINMLAEDLTPTQTLQTRTFWMLGLSCAAALALAVVYLYGLRYDFNRALSEGVMYWKSGLFISAALTSMLLIAQLSRPTGKIVKAYALPLAIGIALFAQQAVVQATEMSTSMLIAKSMSNAYSSQCLLAVITGGILGSSAMWMFWARKIATNNPTLVGALTGMAGSSMAAAAYTLYCSMDTVTYIGLYYIVPIISFTLVGALIGRRALKW